MKRRGSSASPDQPAPVGPVLDENAWAKLIWNTKEEISSRITAVQKTAQMIAGYRWQNGWRRRGSSERPVESKRAESRTSLPTSPDATSDKAPKRMLPDENGSMTDWAAQVELWARHFGKEADRPEELSAEHVIAITREAGDLLGWTELLIVGYDRMVEGAESPAPQPGPKAPTSGAPPGPPPSPEPKPAGNPGSDPPGDPPPPRGPANPTATSRRKEVLIRATTVVNTARDRLNAAQGSARNLVARVGSFELWLLLGVLGVVFVLYAVLHPVWGLRPLPAELRPLTEIVFWSVFGAVAMSALTVASDTMSGVFDPARKFKYVYKIPLAPIVAYTLLLFFGLTGKALTGTSVTSISLEPSEASYPVLILLAFLFGFFVKRSLDLLEGAWNTFFARTTSASPEPEAGAKPSGTEPPTAVSTTGPPT